MLKNNIIISLVILTSFSCSNPKKHTDSYIILSGETMGSTYIIKYKGEKNYQQEIDNELKRINEELSTYIKTSTISRFNFSDSGIIINNTDFWLNLKKANEIYIISEGLYDPTVMPLVNYWGFGYTGHKKVDKIDTAKIVEILQVVGMNRIEIIPKGINNYFIKKPDKRFQLDFSSLAAGYGADKIASLLEDKGINDYMVDITGEIVSKGLSPTNKKWVIGINLPSEEASIDDYLLTVEISDKSIATSGNYRNYFGEGKERYSHTINPKTGFPERSNLLSATILAADCMTADALATACMVSGLEKSKKMISGLKNVEACFIWVDEKNEMQVYITPGFKK